MSDIEKWNGRRLELLAKQKESPLTARERRELNLMERCVDFYIENNFPKRHIEGLRRLMQRLKEVG